MAPIIARCLEGIVKAGESINEKEDSCKVIERLVFCYFELLRKQFKIIDNCWFVINRYQSGFTPPTDILFEDLSKPDVESAHDSQCNNNMQSTTLTIRGTMSANKIKKRVGIFNIFGSSKVCKRINIHIQIDIIFIKICIYYLMMFRTFPLSKLIHFIWK